MSALLPRGLPFATNQPVSDAMGVTADIRLSQDRTPTHGEGSTCWPLCEEGKHRGTRPTAEREDSFQTPEALVSGFLKSMDKRRKEKFRTVQQLVSPGEL